MRIGIDIDGVGFNFGDSCKRYLDHIGQGHLWKSGPNPEPYWDFFKDWGWTGSEFVDFCNRGADAGFIFSGPMRPGYREMIDEIANMGHEIIIATDRPFGSTPDVSEKLTVDWLHEHEINYDELHFTADKTTANCEMFIDDKVENHEALLAAGVDCYLLDRPWNRHYEAHGRRIYALSEFVGKVSARTKSSSMV